MVDAERFRNTFDRFSSRDHTRCVNCNGTEIQNDGAIRAGEQCPCCVQGGVLNFARGSKYHDNFHSVELTRSLDTLDAEEFQNSVELLKKFAADLGAVQTDPVTGKAIRTNIRFKPRDEDVDHGVTGLRMELLELIGENDVRIVDSNLPGDGGGYCLHVTDYELGLLLKNCDPGFGVYGFNRDENPVENRG